jgi:DNA excision repair protein ERCC-2
MQPDSPKTLDYSVAVRTLCDFAAREGDLDLRFTPSPSSQEGVDGHRTVASRRRAGYQSEVALSGRYKNLTVRGRADGYDASAGLLEEVKTFKGDLERMPANHRHLHWAQAKVYGALLCEQNGLPTLDVALVYFDVQAQTEAPALTQRCSASELRQFFENLCERFIAWAASETSHRARRDAALVALRFPHDGFRGGQRALAEAVFNAARSRRCLTAQAPTGIGKTIGTLFPLLKAAPSQSIDKVFFLTAKGSGRSLALNALDTLDAAREGDPAPGLRVIELVAREKACEHPDKACHGDSCPLARGFYDRLPAAREAAVVQRGHLGREALRGLAREHTICPYYLGQELAKWSDVIVGDYNHFFDSSAILHAMTVANEWRAAVLVDEAHNLVDRARSMYSADLSLAALNRVRRSAAPELKRTLDKLHRAWKKMVKAQTADYEVHSAPPSAIASALKDVGAALSAQLAEAPTEVDEELLAFYFKVLQIGRLLDSFDTHSIFDVTLAEAATDAERSSKRDSTLCIRNVVPAPFLAPRFAATHCTVLFSATLTPQSFYADTLGLPADTAWLDVEAPFRAEQLDVHVVRQVSTRFADRGRSLEPIARLIGGQYAARPGNYLAYFSSFDYLEQAAAVFAERCPNVPMWQQARRMDEPARDAFVSRFAVDGRGVGFAVLGGAFAEGIDLPGTRLIGAIIATLGLPQFNAVNEELRRRLEEAFGAGYDYAYLYPGIRKVVQAAGRVIRTPTDRGTVHLVDDRFARPEVLRLLPSWWRVDLARNLHTQAMPVPAQAR